MSEPQIDALLRGQIIRSGHHGRYVITREAVTGMLAQIQERPVPVNIEHDPTQPPVGRVVRGQLVELDDGEVALEIETEMLKGGGPAAIYPVSRLAEAAAALASIPAQVGRLDLVIDERSYRPDDLEELRGIAADVAETNVLDTVVRFSQLPDALLVFELGLPATAAFWFSKGFFSKFGERVGDELGGEVGQDLARAYRALKAKLREVVRRRQPSDRPPLTMLSFMIDRRSGGLIQVEGSSRAEDDGLDDLLDGGQDLLTVARVYAELVPEPERLERLHFAREDGAWKLRYGLDDEAMPVMVLVVSEERYAELLAEAQDSMSSPPLKLPGSSDD